MNNDSRWRLPALYNPRQALGALNLLKPRSNLDTRMNFFSVRVVDGWKVIPSEIRMVKKCASGQEEIQGPQAQPRGALGENDGEGDRATTPTRATCLCHGPT
jgi:hypothetical protein